MLEVGLIEGTKKHRSTTPAVATDFYRSTTARQALEWARRVHHDAVYLSARYGLVELREVLEPYELSLRDLTPGELAEWARGVVRALEENYANDELLLVAYAAPATCQALRQALRELRPRWHLRDPLRGLGWHAREAWFRAQGCTGSPPAMGSTTGDATK